jgi:predicted nucleic acid-binding protein
VWAAIESGQGQGFLAAHAITALHYLVRKQLGQTQAVHLVSEVLRVFQVAAVDEPVIREALGLAFTDFEDAITAAAARAAGCEAIVTRDPRGFRRSPVETLTTEAAALWLSD